MYLQTSICLTVRVRVSVTYNCSMPPRPSKHMTRVFAFLQLKSCSHNSSIKSPLNRGWICLLIQAWSSSSMHITHIAYYSIYSILLKCLPFVLYKILFWFKLSKATHVCLTYLMLQWQVSHLNTH